MSHVDIAQSCLVMDRSNAADFSHGLLSNVSVIIPVGPQDTSWRSLLRDLAGVATDAEVLLVAADAEPSDFIASSVRSGPHDSIRWIATTASRARQMNYGAKLSPRPFLWFLHADSSISVDAVLALQRSLDMHPQALHYFDLAFQDDGPRLVRLNALGTRVRSRYLGLPFGDQGLCISRDRFERLGGFDETAAYGEDHLLVWAAHRQRVPIQCVGAVVATSARKYRSNGWFATTLVHGWRTWRQAIPQFVRLLRSRYG
jgi:hypothetical protein